jgi:hypothetical protein
MAEQGTAYAAGTHWAKAAEAYARSLTLGSTDDGHFWFEYAAVLLSGDRSGYTKACGRLAEQGGKVTGLLRL